MVTCSGLGGTTSDLVHYCLKISVLSVSLRVVGRQAGPSVSRGHVTRRFLPIQVSLVSLEELTGSCTPQSEKRKSPRRSRPALVNGQDPHLGVMRASPAHLGGPCPPV